MIFIKKQGQLEIDSTIKIGADIYDIWEHPTIEEIWISASNGLWKLDLKSFSLSKKLQEQEELMHSPIISIFKDNSHKDCVITNQNIWVINSTRDSFYRFREEDGLHTGQFSLFAKLKDSNGNIWLGTNNGIIRFHMDSINPYPYPSKIYLKNLRINNSPVKSRTVVNEVNLLDLAHNENTIKLKPLGITNYHPELTKIFYKLEGYEEDWKSINNTESIQFTKIPSGVYELKMFSTNANNIKSEIRGLKINIKEPWWNTLWFKLIFITGLILIIYGIFHWTLHRRLNQQKLIFDALQNERNRIASEMHDDLGSGLYSINILIQGIMGKLQSPETPEKIVKVEKKATELVENMREIIWAMDGENDNLLDLIAYIRTFFVEFFDDIPITGKAQIPRDIPQIIVSGKKRRNIFLCVKESVHNIAKHSEADLAELSFTKNHKKLKIKIKDNGIGIDSSYSNKFGNGLNNMKTRMQEIEGTFNITKKNGTIVILEIPIS